MDEGNKFSLGELLFAIGTAIVVMGGFAVYVSAHHNSPMYDFIEENENFDQMDMHESAIENLTDNTSMDTSTNDDMGGMRTDTATQDGSTDGPDGTTNQVRTR